MKIQELIDKASQVVGEYQPSNMVSSGSVGAALLTKKGNVYTGVCIDTASSLGFCAEHAAVAEMLKYHEAEIDMIVAVVKNKGILAPCGRYRELIAQLQKSNMETRIILSHDKTVPLKELLPHYWLDEGGYR